MSEVDRFANESVIRLLVGNKTDRESDRTVTTEEGQTLANQMGLWYIETSAKISNNIEEIFDTTTKLCKEKLKE